MVGAWRPHHNASREIKKQNTFIFLGVHGVLGG
jgi:hypothetical protein